MELDGSSDRYLGEGDAGRLVYGAVGSGDGIAVGIDLGVTESVRHTVHHRVSDSMFQTLRFLVYRVPGIAQKLDQIRFDEAVTADHPQCRAAAFAGKLNPAIGDVVKEAVLRKLLDHSSNRWRRESQEMGDFTGGRRPSLRGELIDGLQIVFNGFGESIGGGRVHERPQFRLA
jgi:hypothetical protein